MMSVYYHKSQFGMQAETHDLDSEIAMFNIKLTPEQTDIFKVYRDFVMTSTVFIDQTELIRRRIALATTLVYTHAYTPNNRK
jgi:hypothetical protein